MAITLFPNSPHFDDFDKAKNFYRMLFRPGQAVQAREMNQVQSIIANQFDTLLSHLFKDGSPVVGAKVGYDDKYAYVKLQSSFTYNSVAYTATNYEEDFDDKIVVGKTTGIKARVLKIVNPVNSDPLTFYVRYERTGTDNVTQVFATDEILELNATNNPEYTGVVRYMKVASANATGYGTAFTADEGYWYARGALVYNPKQIILLNKYSNTGVNARIYFKINDTVVTPDDDASLYDNTVSGVRGGPGAYRQKISLELTIDPLDLDNRPNSSANVIQLMVIKDGRIQTTARTEYSVLADTLAQRTYDESGNYTTTSFPISSKDHDTDTTKIKVGVENGRAYVNGYQVNIEDTVYVDVDKARDIGFANANSLTVRLGSYIIVDTLVSLPQITDYKSLDLKNSGGTTIGTARPRAIKYLRYNSTTSKHEYQLYIFDVTMSGTNSFSAIRSVSQAVTYGGASFSANIPSASVASLIDSDYNNLLFPLPYPVVKSLRSNDNVTVDFTYDANIFLADQNISSTGALSLNNGNVSGVTFTSTSSSDYIVVHKNNGALIPPSDYTVTISSPPTSVTLQVTGHNSTVVEVIAPVRKNLQEKVKTLTNTSLSINTPNTTPGSYDNLRKCDILRIVSVTEVSTSKDITSRYILDNGQRDNFYTQGRIQLRSGAVAPSGAISVNFDYFVHSAGDYFSVDSYANNTNIYSLIPSYNGKSLRDVIDFRPVKSANGVDFDGAGASVGNIVLPNSVVTTDIQYYLPRIDKVCLTKDGKVIVKKGVSAFPPKVPSTPNETMDIYDIYLNAYTFSSKDLSFKLVDNRRYTMRDIGRLEKRINNLEYYTTLSLLEQQTETVRMTDANGMERVKLGFLADSFYGHNYSDTNHPDYRCAIDRGNGELRPSCEINEVRLLLDAGGSSGYQKTGSMVTLPYTEVVEERQPYASESMSVNPYDVVSFIGEIKLSPELDRWQEVRRLPDLISNDESLFDTFRAEFERTGAIGTFWGEWQASFRGWVPVQNWRGQGRVAFQNTDVRTVTRTELTSDTITRNMGDRVVEVNFIPFMRSRLVYFKASKLKPNTRYIPLFDGTNVASYVRQEAFLEFTATSNTSVTNYLNFTSHPVGSTTLTSDDAGNLEGSFLIPNNASLTFRTGTKLFRLVDTEDKDLLNSWAETIYEANGIVETKQNMIQTTRVPRLTRTQTTETRTWFDPLAQTILIDREGGIFLSSIDIFFKTKDPSIPVTLELRTVENGIPTGTVLPFSRVTLQSSQVNTSNNGSVATKFTFESLVHLQQNVEYCFVLLSNSQKYYVYVAKMGEYDVTNPLFRITKQPHAGVMFKSQNGSTWTPDQERDIKFTLNRANFTSLSGTVKLVNEDIAPLFLDTDPLVVTNGSNVIRVLHRNHGMHNGSKVVIAGATGTIAGIPSARINLTHTISGCAQDSYKITITTALGVAINATTSGRVGGDGISATYNIPVHTYRPTFEDVVLPNTDLKYRMKFTSAPVFSSSSASHTFENTALDVINDVDVAHTQPKVVLSKENETTFTSGSKSFVTEVLLSSASSNISPVLDLEQCAFLAIANRIDNPSGSSTTSNNLVDGYVAETVAIGGSCLAKHFTKKNDLNEGATSLKIFMGINRPSSTFVDVYYKVSTSDDAFFNNIAWTLVAPDSEIPYSDDPTTFREVTFTLDDEDIPGGTFTSFAIKTVMRSTNPAQVPRIKNLRVVAGV